MAKQLTELQQKFLEVLFDEAGGDVVAAKKLAGYSDNTPTRLIVDALKEEITEATRTYFSRIAPKACYYCTCSGCHCHGVRGHSVYGDLLRK